MESVPGHSRDLDLVLLGATGAVGWRTAEHLAAYAPPDLRIALAGRDAASLAVVRDALGARAAHWPILAVDLRDESSVATMVARARVVASAAGPYLPHGLGVIGACAQQGVHYVDVTGEVLFMRSSIDRFDRMARQRGARIVHAAGFDSVPSDLAVAQLVERVRVDDAGQLVRATQYWRRLRGAIGQGTLASMLGQVDAAAVDSQADRLVRDPYALCPQSPTRPATRRGAARAGAGAGRSEDVQGWTAPFVMGPVNAQVVHRSNALTGWSYGPDLDYAERLAVGRALSAPLRAAAYATLMPVAARAARLRPTRSLLEAVGNRLASGPDAASRASGRFLCEVHGHTTTGAHYVVAAAAPHDPGYDATAIMLGQSALLLASGEPASADSVGVLTPAVAFGGVLRNRLRMHRFRFESRRQR